MFNAVGRDSKFSLGASIVIGLVFAIPILTFVSAMVVFPMLFYFGLALAANIGLPIVVVAYFLRRERLWTEPHPLFLFWRNASIMWIGCAWGLAHWGDAGSGMGAHNIPYLKVLFAPYLLLFGVRDF